MTVSRLLLFSFLTLAPLAHAAQIGTPILAPASTSAGVAATVTVTVAILDPTIIPNTVNLQQVDSQGRVLRVVGNLADSGDRNFTLRFTVLAQNPGTVTYRVSAGVLGSVTRIFSSPLPFTITGAVPTNISIAQPSNLTFTNISPITISGTAGDPRATVVVNGIPATRSGNGFQASIPLQEGTNPVTAVAMNSNGTSSTAAIQVTLDTTPPHVTIDSPTAAFVTTDASTSVTGSVNDLVVGTVNDQQATVTVNGAQAQVSNRRYVLNNVALSMGDNTVQVVARDRTGNSATASVVVTRQQPAAQSIQIVSGNNQTGVAGQPLAAPLIVRLSNGAANVPVIFKITNNDGVLLPGAQQLIAVQTNAQGQAPANLTLGHRFGAGNNTVQASASGFDGVAVFTASATPQPASQINIDSGNNQFGPIGQALAFPLVAVVTDAAQNRLPNIPVTFTIKQGGGTIGGQTTSQTTTDSDGRALAVLTLGTEPGRDNNIVEATFAGNTGAPARFVATAKAPGDPAQTTISGIVLDNSNVPLPGVTVRLFRPNQGANNNQPVQVGTPVTTDSRGFFRITSAPVGLFKIMADGTTAATPGKKYPTLEFDIASVAGQDNNVGMPMYLPLLDPTALVCVDATTGGVLKPANSPGFSLTIAAGSATFPGGSRSGCVSASPVNPDKVPMTPNLGQQPSFIVTIQPVGTSFNPPAAVTYPNLQGLAPNSKAELYTYDHDLSTFVMIGWGTVSADGSQIVSDPGVGILKAGWNDSGSNPGPTGSAGSLTIHIARDPESTVGPNHKAVVLAKGEVVGLIATIAPAGQSTWSSSDSSVARASGGTITAVGTGKATITASVSNGLGSASDSIEVIVYELTALEMATPVTIVKQKPTDTEIPAPIDALATIVTGVPNVTVPISINFSFADSDDTATNTGIDPNGPLGDDNAPVARGGKRGGVMWKAFDGGFPTTVAFDGQQALVSAQVPATDPSGSPTRISINFLSSAVAGDNYHFKLTAFGAHGRTLKEVDGSIVVPVRRKFTFNGTYLITGTGVSEEDLPPAPAAMTESNIAPAFNGDAYTDYTAGPLTVKIVQSGALFTLPLRLPNGDESPTAEELQAFAGTDPVAKAAAKASLESKATAWYQRVSVNGFEAIGRLRTLGQSLGIKGPAIVGIHCFNGKEDGGAICDQNDNIYPIGIMIPAGPSDGKGGHLPVDVNGQWNPIDLLEVDSGPNAIVWVSKHVSADQLHALALHIAGHASDHASFGDSDHADSDSSSVMSLRTLPIANQFDPQDILHIRGWK